MSLQDELAEVVRAVVREELAHAKPAAPAYDPLQLLRPEDVAKLLGWTTETVRHHLDDKSLPGFKLEGYWRVRRVDLERYLAEQHHAAPRVPDVAEEAERLARDIRSGRKAG